MNETIKDKIRKSTSLILKEYFEIMVQFGIITSKQKQFINIIIDDFKYGDKILKYKSIYYFFEYNKELFDAEFLNKII